MFGIKLKGLKKSGRLNDLNEAYSSLTITPPLNGVRRGQPVLIAIFSIKSNVLMGPLRKYNFPKWVILNPGKILLLPFKCSTVACNQTYPMYFRKQLQPKIGTRMWCCYLKVNHLFVYRCSPFHFKCPAIVTYLLF